MTAWILSHPKNGMLAVLLSGGPGTLRMQIDEQ
jgi:hypothetical protein